MFNCLSGVAVSIWYDWRNDGQDTNRIAYNRGLVTADLKPKPSYRAIQILTSQLSGYRISREYGTGNDADFVLVLTNAEETTKLAAWTTGENHTVNMALEHGASVNKLPWINGNGDSGTLDIKGGKFACELTSTPEYITLGKERLGN